MLDYITKYILNPAALGLMAGFTIANFLESIYNFGSWIGSFLLLFLFLISCFIIFIQYKNEKLFEQNPDLYIANYVQSYLYLEQIKKSFYDFLKF